MSITYPSCGSATQSTKEQMNLREIGYVLGVSESRHECSCGSATHSTKEHLINNHGWSYYSPSLVSRFFERISSRTVSNKRSATASGSTLNRFSLIACLISSRFSLDI